MRAHSTSWKRATALLALLAATTLAAAILPVVAAAGTGAAGLPHATVQTLPTPTQGVPSRAALTTTLSGISCSGRGIAWTCGLHDTIYRTTDGGATWSQLSSPLPADEEVTDIEFVSPTTGYATGAGNAILRTTNGGASWSVKVTSGSAYTPYLLEVSAVDATHAWAAGYSTANYSTYHNVVARTTDGATWNLSGNLLVDEGWGWGVTGVDFPDRLHGWGAISDGEIIFSNDGGAVWTPPLDVPGATSFFDVSFADATHGWVVGEDATYHGFIMHTSDGQDWYRQAQGIVGLDPLPSVRAVWAVNQSVAWAACAGGYVLRTTDGGASWEYNRSTTAGLNAVAASSADVCWVAGDNGTVIRYGDQYVAPKPSLDRLKPASGRIRSTVTLSGHGFGALRDGACSVKFGAKKAAVKSWSDRQIKVTVPSGIPRGYVKVKVVTAGGASAARKFLRR